MKPDLLLLAPALESVQHLIERLDERGMIIGGVAVSLLSRPRLTADVDAMVLLDTDELPRLLAIAEQEGLLPRMSDAADFARRHRVLLLQHQESGVNVDISLGLLPFEVEAIERSKIYQIGTLTLRIPTPEDLIVFKAVAHRPKDLLDIQALIESCINLDNKYIADRVHEFAQLLEMPELWDDIAPWLKSPK